MASAKSVGENVLKTGFSKEPILIEDTSITVLIISFVEAAWPSGLGRFEI